MPAHESHIPELDPTLQGDILSVIERAGPDNPPPERPAVPKPVGIILRGPHPDLPYPRTDSNDFLYTRTETGVLVEWTGDPNSWGLPLGVEKFTGKKNMLNTHENAEDARIGSGLGYTFVDIPAPGSRRGSTHTVAVYGEGHAFGEVMSSFEKAFPEVVQTYKDAGIRPRASGEPVSFTAEEVGVSVAPRGPYRAKFCDTPASTLREHVRTRIFELGKMSYDELPDHGPEAGHNVAEAYDTHIQTALALFGAGDSARPAIKTRLATYLAADQPQREALLKEWRMDNKTITAYNPDTSAWWQTKEAEASSEPAPEPEGAAAPDAAASPEAAAEVPAVGGEEAPEAPRRRSLRSRARGLLARAATGAVLYTAQAVGQATGRVQEYLGHEEHGRRRRRAVGAALGIVAAGAVIVAGKYGYDHLFHNSAPDVPTPQGSGGGSGSTATALPSTPKPPSSGVPEVQPPISINPEASHAVTLPSFNPTTGEGTVSHIAVQELAQHGVHNPSAQQIHEVSSQIGHFNGWNFDDMRHLADGTQVHVPTDLDIPN